MISMPALDKEKCTLGQANAQGDLDDSDCEDSMRAGKKPCATRKLSMVDEEDDE